MKKFLLLLITAAQIFILCSLNEMPERTYEFEKAWGNAQKLDIYCEKTGERTINLIKDGYKILLGKNCVSLEKSGTLLTVSEYPGMKENIGISAVFFVENSEYGTQTVFSLGGKEYINFTDFSRYKKQNEITVSVPKGQSVSVAASETEYTPEVKVYLNKYLKMPAYASRKVNWYRTDEKLNYYGGKPLNPGEKTAYSGFYAPALLDTGCTVYAEYGGKILGYAKVSGKCAVYVRGDNIAFANGRYNLMEEITPKSDYVPLRYTCDALKIKLSYSAEKIKLKHGKNTAVLYENKDYIMYNDKKIGFDKSAVYVQNNTAMAHKNIFSALGCNVYESENTAAISRDTELKNIGEFSRKAAIIKSVADANQNLITPVTLIGSDSALCGIVTSENVKSNVPAAVYVNTAKKAKQLQNGMSETNPQEIFVISKKMSCVKKLSERFPLVHGVLDLRGESEKEKILRKTLSSNCRIALLDNAENAYYLSKFNVSVWIKPKTAEEFYKGIIDGAVGIITDDAEKSAKLMQIFSEPTMLGKCAVYGHRGTAAYEYEDTVSAAKKAISVGADYIEFDIWQTKDKEAVVMHDGTTGRMCGKDLVIKDSTLEELKALDVGGEKIPTLKEYLSALKEYENVVFNIEIKGGTAELVKTAADTLKELGMTPRAHISSYDVSVQKLLNMTAPYLVCTAWSNSVYTDIGQVYSAENGANTVLAGVKEPTLRKLRLRGERRLKTIDVDAEYRALGKNFSGYTSYSECIPHEIVVENGAPKVLNRMGTEISVPDLEEIVSDGVLMYRCKVKRINAVPYYIYGIQ